MSTRKIWFNVTSSKMWNRPAVGILRVESELRRHLKNLYPASEFKDCYWNGKEFVETVYEPGPQKTQNSLVNVPKEEMVFPILPRVQAVFAIAQGVLSLAPRRVRPYLSRFIRVSKIKLGQALNKALILKSKNSLRHLKTGSGDRSFSHPFSKNDIFISVGLDWDSDYSQYFYQLRVHDQVKVVTFCHDLIPILYPQYCLSSVVERFPAYLLDLAEGSDLILCNSLQSQSDLNAFLHSTGGRVATTHLFSMGSNILSPVGGVHDEVAKLLSSPFILFVSTLERRKNHEVLYRAYHLLRRADPHLKLPKLLFVGMSGWGVSELLTDIARDPLVKDLIVHLDGVNDAELLCLYEAALFCVFPSLYEGWGLPLSEALSLGKVVISSQRGSLPEVGGDLVIYADPWKPQEWAEAILKLLGDGQYLERMKIQVREKYSAKTWEYSAQEVMKVLANL